jgi:hypothetical protein
MKISQVMTLCPLLVGALVLANGGKGIYQATVSHSDKVSVADGVEVVNALGVGIIELSLERSIVQVTSNLATPIAPEYKKLLQEQRRKSDAAFDEAKDFIKSHSNEMVMAEKFLAPLRVCPQLEDSQNG